jgi:glycosidase
MKDRILRFAMVYACAVLTAGTTHPQSMHITKIEPPNWWVGMASNTVQLMVYGEHLSGVSVESESPQITVTRVHKTSNPSYAFVDIEIAPGAFEGFHRILFTHGKDSAAFSYLLLRRKHSTTNHRGFNASDVVYLVTPDRFANGDTTNDTVDGYPDGKDRNASFGRHGGDIQGILNHLDYIADLGVTALWVNPLIENNMSFASYHGYAATDLYRIDPRFGTNDKYTDLVRQAHARGLKVILDHVSNHIGLRHPWLKDLPFSDWLHGSAASHSRSSGDKNELTDIHADSTYAATVRSGWFVDSMPDLNQANPFVSRYLIQNTLWWIESSGVDGIREDTYPYADPFYLSAWAAAIFANYPSLTIVGEVWTGDPAFLCMYQKGSRIPTQPRPTLTSVTDFALYDALTQVSRARGSIKSVYECLSHDHLYADPYALLTFVDNHDTRRILYVTQGDTKRALLALTILLTTRGMPELLYGTEIARVGGQDDGLVRGDFPGGFPGDSVNSFTAAGRTAEQNSYFASLRQLLHLRKQRHSLSRGRLVHYPPVNEIYAYFRILGKERTMIVVNNKEERQSVGLAQFRGQLAGAVTLRNLQTDEVVDLASASELAVDGDTAAIFAVQ